MKFIKMLQEKLVLQLIILVLFLFFLLLGAFYATQEHTRRLTEQSILELGKNNLALANAQLESHYDALSSLAASFCYSPTAEQYLAKDSLSRFQDAEDLSSVFANTLLLNQDIRSIYLYQPDMERIASFGKEFDIPDSEGLPVEKAGVGDGLLSEQAGRLCYPYYYPIYDLRNPTAHDLLGLCVIILTPDSLDEILEESKPTSHSELYLLDRNQRILSSSSPTNLSHFPEELLQSSREHQVQSIRTPASGWRIVSRIPAYELQQQGLGVGPGILLLYGISTCLLLLLICFCYFHIIRPLRLVDGFIRSSTKHPAQRLRLGRKDEIGTVSASLNRMLDIQQEMNAKIQLSQKKMYETELSKKQAQIIAYQNQINPHFLYNTLECIRDMALYYEADSIAEITMALSFLFRYAVKGNSIVTIAEEAEYIQEYAKIIAYRFMGKISIDISMDPDAAGKEMVKMLLQPLVENAVFHGLEQKAEDGLVDIRIESGKGGKICFAVSDDGCGMSQERLKTLREEIQEPGHSNRIGLANIYQRLRLFYGDSFSFQIESSLGDGTYVAISIPDTVTEQAAKEGCL